jgi:hypothetical protein
MRRASLLLTALGFAACLAGCATARDDGFPSLALRDAERVTGTLAPPPPPARPSIVPEAAVSRLASLRAQALTAHQTFGQGRARAGALVQAARGAAVGSESWAVAQVALAGLEATRSQAMVALADVDRLYVTASESASATGGSAELDTVVRARDEVSGWIAQEDAVLAGLRGSLRE